LNLFEIIISYRKDYVVPNEVFATWVSWFHELGTSKRFPTEDAFVFVTKSAADYKRVLGAEPDPGVVMTAVADLDQLRNVCRIIEDIQHWLSAATNDLESAFLESKGNPTNR
jgi:hypothetical protein